MTGIPHSRSTTHRRRVLEPGPPPRERPYLDEVDRELLAALQVDGRRSVASLARDCGLAESTCAGRLRSLVDRGVIEGFHAAIDPAALGLAVEAMVAIRITGHTRTQVEDFRDSVAAVPGVLTIYNTSGANDFLVHVATAGADALRAFVLDHLASRPEVAHAETSLIFEATRGAGLIAPPA